MYPSSSLWQCISVHCLNPRHRAQAEWRSPCDLVQVSYDMRFPPESPGISRPGMSETCCLHWNHLWENNLLQREPQTGESVNTQNPKSFFVPVTYWSLFEMKRNGTTFKHEQDWMITLAHPSKSETKKHMQNMTLPRQTLLPHVHLTSELQQEWYSYAAAQSYGKAYSALQEYAQQASNV